MIHSLLHMIFCYNYEEKKRLHLSAACIFLLHASFVQQLGSRALVNESINKKFLLKITLEIRERVYCYISYQKTFHF